MRGEKQTEKKKIGTERWGRRNLINFISVRNSAARALTITTSKTERHRNGCKYFAFLSVLLRVFLFRLFRRRRRRPRRERECRYIIIYINLAGGARL